MIIIRDIEQGTPEWHQLRNGIPTASMMGSIITSQGKPSSQSAGYMNQLLADWKAGHPVDMWQGNKYSEDGKEREPQCRALYELLTDSTTEEVSFIYKNDNRLVGCSPDGLVNDDGLLEMKNPKGSTFIGYLLDGKIPSTYVPQVQAQMWIAERDWCDFMFQHPELGHKIIRAGRDEKFISLMSGMVTKFIEEMLAKREKLKTL